MQEAISSAMADDLMAIQAHLTTRPKHVPGNLVTAVSWHAIGELYHVSQSPLEIIGLPANFFFPGECPALGAHRPPWELPDYVGNLLWALQDTGAWIAAGGIVEQVVVAPPPTLSQPLPPSDGESEAGVSDKELPSPQQLVPKVQRSDEVEHTLDKGWWAGTRATQQGWKIFVKASPPNFSF